MQLTDIIDKFILFLMSLALYIHIIGTKDSLSLLLAILIALIASALLAYTNKAFWHHTIIITYLMVCLIMPAAVFFLPSIVYTWFFSYAHSFQLLTLLILAINSGQYPLSDLLVLIALLIIAGLIKYRTLTSSYKSQAYLELEDRTRELTYTLKHQHQQLLESQDSEIYHATLNERHRIAREIHDHVGHVLSRALLQIGALLAINKEPTLQQDLRALRDTLNQGMDNIRSSVHDLHDTSIDLDASIRKITSEFTFCPIDLDLHMTGSPPQTVKYAIIAIVKEGLNNIMKHSHATEVTLRLHEHHAFYQLVLSDNGDVSDYKLDQGIGLQNIRERIEKLGGRLNIDTKEGFRLFITLPREETNIYD